MAKSKKNVNVSEMIGRRGTEATIAFRSLKGGVMESSNTRRNRSRTDQKRNAIREYED